MLTMTNNYSSMSAKRMELWKAVVENEKCAGVHTWQTMSGTRWLARSSNFSAMVNSMNFLLAVLDNLQLETYEKKSNIFSFIDNFRTVTTIMCIQLTLERINLVSVRIKEKSGDIGKINYFMINLTNDTCTYLVDDELFYR